MNPTQDPTSLREIVANRRSLGLARLKEDAVDPQILHQALEAANWAPSHGQTEPWRFVVFTGTGRRKLAETLATSAALLKGQEQPDPELLRLQQARQEMAPVWIAVAAEPAEKPKMPLYEEQWAVACAVQTLLLAARSLDIGSKWISNAPSLHPNTASSLGFAPSATMMGLVYLGYLREDGAGHDPWPAGRRRPVSEKVRWLDE